MRNNVTPTSRSDLDFGGAPFMKRQIESLRKEREKSSSKKRSGIRISKGTERTNAK